MKLTDKAQKQFESWRFDYCHNYIYDLPLIFKQSLILGFFRSEGYHISVYPHGDGINWCFGITDLKDDPNKSIFERLSYRIFKENEELKVDDYGKCLELAIEKTNEIYNSRP